MSRSTNGRIRTSGQSVRFGIQARWRKAAAVMLSVALVCGSVVLPERTAEAMELQVAKVNPAEKSVVIEFALQQTQPVDIEVWVKGPDDTDFILKDIIVSSKEFQGSEPMVAHRYDCALTNRLQLLSIPLEECSTSEPGISSEEAVMTGPATKAEEKTTKTEEPEGTESTKAEEPKREEEITEEESVPMPEPDQETMPEPDQETIDKVTEPTAIGSLMGLTASLESDENSRPTTSAAWEAGEDEPKETNPVVSNEAPNGPNPVVSPIQIQSGELPEPSSKRLRSINTKTNATEAEEIISKINDSVSYSTFQRDGKPWNRLYWDGRISVSGAAVTGGRVPVFLPSGTDGETDQVEVKIAIQPLGYPDKDYKPTCYIKHEGKENEEEVHVPEDHMSNWLWTRAYREESAPFIIDYLGDMEQITVSSLFDLLKKYLPDWFKGKLQNLFEDLDLDYCWLDPINMVTGAYVTEYPDLQLEGEYPLTFLRLYSSTDQRVGSLGKGGSHSWDYTLEETGGIIQLIGPFGERAVFLRLEDGGIHTLGSSAFQLEETSGKMTFTYQGGAKLEFNFDQSSGKGSLSKAINPQGVTVAQFSYSGDHLSEMRNLSGSIYLNWDGDQIDSVTDSAGRTVNYGYRGDNLIRVENPDGDSLHFDYDENGFLTKCTDFDQKIYLENEYDEKGRVVSQVLYNGTEEHPEKTTSTITYQEEELTTTVTSGSGEKRVYHYDEYGAIQSIEEPEGTSSNSRIERSSIADSQTNKEGAQIQYTFDSHKNVTKALYPDGSSVTVDYQYMGDTPLPTGITYRDGKSQSYSERCTYDSKGNLTSYTDRSGHTTTYSYNGNCLPTSETNGEGETTSYAYDSSGRLIEEKDPLGSKTHYTYDDVGRMTAMTDANGNITTYEYSAAGKLKSVTLPSGLKQGFQYTGNGFQTKSAYSLETVGSVETAAEYGFNNALIRSTDELGKQTEYEYDKDGQLTAFTDPNGGRTEYEYDTLGRMTSETDPDGSTITYRYDQMNRPIEVKNSQSGSETYEYDSMGRVTVYTDQNGAETSYDYNLFGQVTSMTDGEGNVTRITYTPNGNIEKITDANRNSTKYTYDKADRVIKVTDGNSHTTNYEYDAAGRVTKITDGAGRTTQQTYDRVGNVLTQTNALNNTTSYTYDCMNQPLTQKNPDGTSKIFQYDLAMNLLSEKDEAGRTTAYAYDAKNRLIRMTNAAGDVTEFQYDAMDRAVQIRYPDGSVEENKYTEAGDLVRAVDPKGNRTDYEYDSLHRLTQTIDPGGVITRYFYDPAGNVTQVMIGGKPVVSRTYNAAGFLTSETDGEGNRSEIHCDGVGNLIRMTDARGHAKQYEYDGCNQLVKEINALGKEKSYTYDPTGLLIRETDENGHATDYGYDLSGNLIQIKNAANGILAFEYNSRRQLTAFTDPRGNRTAYTLDPVGQVLETINPMGQKETCAYDSLGNQVEYQDVSGNIMRYTYDPMGRCLSQRDFNNHLSYFAYDKAGNLISQTDRNQHVMHYEYDGLNRLKKVTDPEGGITEYAYHPLGQISDITAFGGGNVRQTTHYEYDSAGRLISEVSPSQAKTGYIYDQAGNPVKKRLPDGNELTYEYDEINRLISADFGDGTKAQYEYDAVGNLTKLQDIRIESGQSKTATEETDFTYDQLNRLIQVTYPNGASAAYEYDANGNKEKITYPDSKAIRYAYDALNRPVNLTDHDGSVIQYEYNPVGTLKRETHENGTTTEYTYDELRRVNGIEETDTHKKRQRLLSYSYDSESNLTGEFRYNVDVDVRDEAVMYSYDQADKLIKTTVGGKTTNYTYDKAGNLIREQKPGEITSYLYDQENRLLSKNGPEGQTSYVYDRTGNLIRQSGSGGTRTFEYDGRGLLAKATNEKGETTEYTYNGLGVRVKNVQVRDNRNTGHRNLRLERGSLYIPDYMPTLIEDRYNWQRVFETEVGTVVQNDREVVEKEYLTDYTSPANRDMLVKEAGSYTQRYLYDLDGRRIRAEFDYAEGTKSGEAGANPASRIAAEQTGKIGYRTSLINSSLYAIKEDGSVISHMIYDEWGNPQTETRQDMNYAGIDNMNNYTGYTYDEVMGIYFAQARFYDPVDKRFIQEDPVKDGSNWYAYCGGNPVTHVDPLGEYYIVTTYDASRDLPFHFEAVPQGPFSTVLETFAKSNAALKYVANSIEGSLFNVVGGNSFDSSYDIKAVVKEVVSEGINKGIQEGIKKVSQHAATAFGWIGTATSIGTSAAKSYDIGMADKAIFKLAGLSHVRMEGVTFEQVEIQMKKAYEFVLSNQSYFFNTPWGGAPTYFEMQLNIYHSSDPVALIDKYFYKFQCEWGSRSGKQIQFDTPPKGKHIATIDELKTYEEWFRDGFLFQYAGVKDIAEQFRAYLMYGGPDAKWTSGT